MNQSAGSQTDLSFEFFPPRSPEARARLEVTRARLATLAPQFFSVTYGAGGSTRELTLETVLELRSVTGVDSAPHISCIGTSAAEIRSTLETYRSEGISRVVALRGDLPSGTTSLGELRYANELVAFIRAEFGDHFLIEVASYPEVHPQAGGARLDLENFKRKVDAGASGSITQYFFNADAYFDFVERARASGIGIPIVPGIMPVTNYTNLKRFSDMCGAEIPRWMTQRLRDFGDDRDAIGRFGLDITTRLCERLLAGGAPGLHFYTMNQYEAPVAICANLGLAPA
ncbi:MAG: methylenetetrahydrofolate reductase [NAD(P)H] [Gammaproteobacteria bacterium]